MHKIRITRGQALAINAVGAVVANSNPHTPIDLGTGSLWILYRYDRPRGKWAYYLCGQEDAVKEAIAGIAR